MVCLVRSVLDAWDAAPKLQKKKYTMIQKVRDVLNALEVSTVLADEKHTPSFVSANIAEMKEICKKDATVLSSNWESPLYLHLVKFTAPIPIECLSPFIPFPTDPG